jgi:hypothetical protein
MATRHQHREIVKNNPIAPSPKDLSEWGQLALPRNAASALKKDRVEYQITAGVFGADLTEFLYACGQTAFCDYDLYYGFYDGWAVGV